MMYNGKVMRNEHIGNSELFLKITQQVDGACTDTSKADTASSRTINLGSRTR
jgi:hypothetical protein